MAESQIPALPLIAPGAPLTLEMLRDHYNALAKAFNRARPISSADVQTLTTDAGTTSTIGAVTISHNLALNCEADPPAITGSITVTIGG